MADRKRSGFTLVELLVVIVIIAMLVGLLLPAINSARANARQAECINKQHEIALAIQQYQTAKRELPGYRNSFGGNNPSVPVARQLPLSWTVVLLQYMDNRELWRDWRRPPDPNNPPPTPQLAQLICPAAHRDQITLSYVANTGLMDLPLPSPLDPNNPLEREHTGVFLDRFYYRRPAVTTERMTDGAQYTLLFSENLHGGNWWDNREAEVGMVWSDDPLAPGQCETPSQPATLPVHINDCKDDPPLPSSRDIFYARPSSNHPAGVVMTYADGHQDTLSEQDVDYGVYQRQMAPDDQEAGLTP